MLDWDLIGMNNVICNNKEAVYLRSYYELVNLTDVQRYKFASKRRQTLHTFSLPLTNHLDVNYVAIVRIITLTIG